MPHAVRKKVVVVGDGTCGKTSLLMTYVRGSMPTEYIPTVFDTYVTSEEVDGVQVSHATNHAVLHSYYLDY